MLTVDFERLGVGPGTRVLDVGCGGGRHAIEALRRGAVAVAVDVSLGELRRARDAADVAADLLGEPLRGGPVRATGAAAGALPFADGSFDVVIASEVLEHLDDDATAVAEIVRVTRPGGSVAVTVPRAFPELVCWALSRDYHSVEGGHVRIYRRRRLRALLRAAGLEVTGRAHAHALHTPYWWLRCLLGVHREPGHAPVRLYHRLLVWDLMKRPAATRWAERALNPVMGKSLVLYARPRARAAAGTVATAAPGQAHCGAEGVDVAA